LKPNRTVIRII